VIHALALRVARSKLRDPGDAEEVAQEATLRLWRFREALERATSPEAWIVRVSSNEALRLRERRGRVLSREGHLEEGFGMPNVQTLDLDEPVHDRVAVMAELEQLTELDRLILLLHYFGDESLPDIAQRLHLPLGTIKARISRARRRMAGKLAA
jgi:RNA polymerase sigma-70 factor, ECF subfamily